MQYLSVIQMIESRQDQLESENTTKLPPDLWSNIASYLRPKSLLSFALTCKFFQHIFETEDIWQRLFWQYTRQYQAVLHDEERSWKLKFKYCTGIITKQGRLHRRAGYIFERWDPIWVVLAGFQLYIFDVASLDQREEELRDLGSLGLNTLKQYYQPTEEINLKYAMLLKQTGGKDDGHLKFGIKSQQRELFFMAKDDQANQWIKLLCVQIQKIQRDYNCRS